MSATYISNITIRFQSVDEHEAGDLGISYRSLRRESPLGAGWCYVPATKDSEIHPHRQPSRQPQGGSGRHGRPHPPAPSRPGDDRGEGTLELHRETYQSVFNRYGKEAMILESPELQFLESHL